MRGKAVYTKVNMVWPRKTGDKLGARHIVLYITYDVIAILV